MSSEVNELIAALRAGTITLDQVAERFRERSWPDVACARPISYPEIAAMSLEDPEPYIPGSFDDVLAAYYRHDLTRDEYRILAQAAAEGMDAEDRRARGETGDG